MFVENGTARCIVLIAKHSPLAIDRDLEGWVEVLVNDPEETADNLHASGVASSSKDAASPTSIPGAG